jgi:hypothetical protein
LVREPLRLTEDAFLLVRVGALLAAAAAQLAVTPSLVQGFLDGGLVAWYERKHGSLGAGAGGGGGAFLLTASKVRGAVRQKLELTNHIVCKVAVQATAPAVLLLSCGCLLGCKRWGGYLYRPGGGRRQPLHSRTTLEEKLPRPKQSTLRLHACTGTGITHALMLLKVLRCTLQA